MHLSPAVGAAPLTPFQIGLVFFAFFMGGVGKGISGFGMPMISISIMTTVLPAELALPLNAVTPLILNVWQAGPPKLLLANLRWLWPVILGLAIGTWLGTLLLTSLHPSVVLGVIGIAILVFCALSLAKALPTLPRRHAKPVGFVAGTISGVTGALTTLQGAPLVVYLVGLGLDHRAMVSALGLLFLTGAAVLVTAFSSVGYLNAATAPWALAGVLPAGLGMWVGRKLAGRFDPLTFRRVVLVFLAILALNLLRRAFF